jgi:hypothetical protein
LKKIAQLQKDLKKKKETILKLTTELRKLGKRVTVKNLNRYDESGDNLEDEDNQSVILHVENEEEWRNLEEENRLLLEELEALRSKLTENSEHYLEAEQNYKGNEWLIRYSLSLGRVAGEDEPRARYLEPREEDSSRKGKQNVRKTHGAAGRKWGLQRGAFEDQRR